eukprot:3549966-Pyramimonas_sp.AAC.1
MWLTPPLFAAWIAARNHRGPIGGRTSTRGCTQAASETRDAVTLEHHMLSGLVGFKMIRRGLEQA